MLAVIIPAHNEAAVIEHCVSSVSVAAQHPELENEEVLIVVVADDCSDFTGTRASAAGAVVICVNRRNVGAARATGAQFALAQGARWLAFTDADTQVPDDWLSRQLACNTDAVCGVVSVSDWAEHHACVKDDFSASYRDVDGHRHIHGANLGCTSTAYSNAGGFPPLTFNEDVALVDALIASGATIAWTNQVRVFTSARRDFKAPWGFGATLRAAAERLLRLDTATLG